ncbi:MAG: alpha/beta fold hydrolase [Micavibrio sp.]
MREPLNLTQTFNRIDYQPPGWRDGYFTNQYNHRLHYGFAPSAAAEKRGTVVLTHGYGEFIDLYYLAIKEYQKMGYDVWAMDFYGFGKSGRDDPANPHTPSTKGMLRHVNDLDFFARNVVERVPGKPMIMSTHSMGGHIGMMHLQRHPGVFDGAVMSAPLLDVYRLGLPSFFRPIVRTFFNIASALGLRDREVPASSALWNKINRASDTLKDSNNGGLREAFNIMMRGAVPDARVNRPTFGWVAKIFNTIARSNSDEALRSVKVPVLIGSAGYETLVDNGAHEKAAQLMGNTTLVKLPTAQHGLWFEGDKNYNLWLKNVQAFTGRLSTDYELARAKADEIPVDTAETPRKLHPSFPFAPQQKAPDPVPV